MAPFSVCIVSLFYSVIPWRILHVLLPNKVKLRISRMVIPVTIRPPGKIQALDSRSSVTSEDILSH